MNKTKIWLIVAVALILVGLIIFAGVMTMLKWDFSKLSTEKYVTNEYTVREKFEKIIIRTKTADVKLIPAENPETTVVCYEADNARHIVDVTDSSLSIELHDNRKWYDHIGINFSSPKVTVYIPEGKYTSLSVKTSTGTVNIPNNFSFESIDISGNTGSITCNSSAADNIKIKNSTGSIKLENVSAGNIDIELTTGKVTLAGIICKNDISMETSTGKTELSNVKCKNLISEGDTGSVSLKNVLASEKFEIERDTGNVIFDECDAAELYVETDTGDVSGSLLTSKIFMAESDTGKVDVPRTVDGGRCVISTDTGDIKISILS